MKQLALSLLLTATIMAAAAQAEFVLVEVDDTTITVEWTAPGDDGAIGTAAAYDIRYSTSPIPDTLVWNAATQVQDEPAPDTAGTTQGYQLTGLQPNTTYFIRIRSVDEAGNWSGLSNEVVGLTKDTVPPCDIEDCRIVGP